MRVPVKRTVAALLCAVTLLFAAGCRRKAVIVIPETTAPPETAATVTTAAPTEPITTPAPETTAAPLPAETGTAPPTAPSAPQTEPEPLQTEAPAQTEPEITLPIELPAANGEMQVSTDPENPFIKAVSVSRGLDVSLLAAVYSVPASGQNYVFEFTAAGSRTAEALRRVYLLSDDAVVKSVAASSAAEREHISLTENWFCMNVLIKGVIFPSVQDKMQ